MSAELEVLQNTFHREIQSQLLADCVAFDAWTSDSMTQSGLLKQRKTKK